VLLYYENDEEYHDVWHCCHKIFDVKLVFKSDNPYLENYESHPSSNNTNFFPWIIFICFKEIRCMLQRIQQHYEVYPFIELEKNLAERLLIVIKILLVLFRYQEEVHVIVCWVYLFFNKIKLFFINSNILIF